MNDGEVHIHPTLGQLTPAERAYADRRMSNSKYQVDCTNEKSYGDFLQKQKQRRKKKQAVSTSSREVEVMSDDVLPLERVIPMRGKTKRTHESADLSLSDGSVCFNIPADASVHSGYDALSEQLEKLLLDADKARLARFSTPSRMARMASGHSLVAYQHSLFMMNSLEEGERKVAELERERARLALEIDKAKKEWSSLEHLHRDQLAAKEQELHSAMALVAEMKNRMAEMEASTKEEIGEACAETLVCSRGQMAEQFLAGETSQWNTSEWVSEYHQFLAIRDGTASGDGDDDGVGGE